MSKIETILITIGLWILSIVAVFFITKTKFPKIDTVVKQVNVPYEVPVYYKDSSGITHAQLKTVELERDQYKSQLDSISRIIKVKSGDITSVNNIITSTKADIQGINPPFIPKDTSFSLFQSNNYMTLSGEVSPKRYNIYVSMIDTLTTVSYVKNHLFKSNELFLDISNTNPYVSIQSGRSVQIKEKKPLFVVGPYIGYEVFPKPHISFGISITKPIITIK